MYMQDANRTECAKRAYQAPQLVVYGNLVDLTATGSGSASESNMDSQSGMPCAPQWKAHSSCAGVM